MSETTTPRFEELKEQIAKLYEIAPGSKYLALLKAKPEQTIEYRSEMAKQIMGIFANSFQAPVIVLIVDDPDNDVRVLEMKP